MTTMHTRFGSEITGWKISSGVGLAVAGLMILIIAIAAFVAS